MKLCQTFIFLVAFSQLSSVKAEDNPSLELMHGLNSPSHIGLYSEVLERNLDILVRLPEGDLTTGTLYPTVYLLDGGHLFPMLASYYRYLELEGAVTPMIIVGISYGTDDWTLGNSRSTDFTAPAPGRSHYGGAAKFMEAFGKNIIPAIESAYPSDARKRILFGQSLGGQFVLFVAQENPGLFWGYIASNPALHRNLEYFLPKNIMPVRTEARLFVSLAQYDEPRFAAPANSWVTHWREKKDAPWDMAVKAQPDVGHFSAAPLAFKSGLQWIFQVSNTKG